MKKKLITESGILAAAVFSHAAAVITSGAVNILYSLLIEGITASVTAVISCAALAVYIAGAFISYRRRFVELAGFGTAFWGVTLFGFIFYAAFNIFDIPISFIIPNMTAFLRLMMMLFTLPMLAVNYLIFVIPNEWIAFSCALALPLSLFIFYLVLYIKIKKAKKNEKAND
jgi:hypothetical protein